MTTPATPEKSPLRGKRSRIYHHRSTEGELPPDADFPIRLRNSMDKKGWNQSETARRAQVHMPENLHFDRQSISAYLSGQNMPSQVRLNALADALGVEPHELVPTASWMGAPRRMESADNVVPLHGREAARSNGISMTTDGPGGRVKLHVNIECDFAEAMKIMAAISEAKTLVHV